MVKGQQLHIQESKNKTRVNLQRMHNKKANIESHDQFKITIYTNNYFTSREN